MVPSLHPEVHDMHGTKKYIGLWDLAPEIRNIMWKYALPKSRVIRASLGSRREVATRFGQFSCVPTILHVCRESRTFALSELELGFNQKSDRFYWNPRIDMVLLDSDYSISEATYAPGEQIPGLQHLGLLVNTHTPRNILPGGDKWQFIVDITNAFPHLKSFSIVYSPNGRVDSGFLRVPVLYEPTDVPVSHFGISPSKIVDSISARLEESRAQMNDSKEAPLVEMLVVVYKHARPNSLCINPGRST